MSGHSFRHNDCRNTESNRDNNMKRHINIDDIAQINRESLERLTKEDIISLARFSVFEKNILILQQIII